MTQPNCVLEHGVVLRSEGLYTSYIMVTMVLIAGNIACLKSDLVHGVVIVRGCEGQEVFLGDFCGLRTAW